MTTEERADYICEVLKNYSVEFSYVKLHKLISEQIHEAEEEAETRGLEEGYSGGMRVAYKDAIKYLKHRASLIRGDWCEPDLLNQSANEIRARLKKIKREGLANGVRARAKDVAR